jgi:hypothetical protein
MFLCIYPSFSPLIVTAPSMTYYTKKRQGVANFSYEWEKIKMSPFDPEAGRRWKSKNPRPNSQLVPKSINNPKVS